MLKVVFCAAEAAPYAKVGGLGDVVGSLPKALACLDIEPIIVLPRYGCIDPSEFHLERLDLKFVVTVMGKAYSVGVWKTHLPVGGSSHPSLPVYFIENEEFFASRQSVYPLHQLQLEVEGFLLLSKSLFELLPRINFQPGIIHLHDWHTSHAAVDLVEYREIHPFFHNTRSVLTIHNMAYQGIYGGLNCLAEGIRHADFITAVSPTYAEEIQTPEGGAGLEQDVIVKGKAVRGILNGIDTALFDPQTDAFIPENYNRETFLAGKAVCKKVLQEELGLSIRPEVPLIGMVTRLVEQKGLDLLIPIFDLLSQKQAQWVFLGTGEPAYEELLKDLNGRYPNIRSYIGFNLAMAQKIYAGSDMFLMPSRFEPCGLGQMIALRYGTVPLVRSTGGLVDTVFDIRKNYDLGNGFCFGPYHSSALLETVDSAISYYKDPQTWRQLIQNGMAEDFSWERSAKQYREVYHHVLQPQSIKSR